MGRNLAAIVGVATLILSGVVGCGKADRARLDRADSLLSADSADSALRILDAIDPDDLWGSEQRAYYALLKTQAHYKCYLPIKSDSLISIAVRYYTDNYDQRKLTKALMYRGAVYADIKFKRMALDDYKEAEKIADTTDLMTIGLLNFRIGELYHTSFIENSEPIERYRRAAAYFKQVGHELFENYSYAFLGQLYIIENYDSAYHYINKVINWAVKQNDQKQLLNGCYLDLSKLYWYYDVKLDERKELLLSAYRDQDSMEVSSDLCHHLADVYSKLGMIDSAKYFADQFQLSEELSDTMRYHMMIKSLAIAQNDYKTAYHSLDLAHQAADTIIVRGKAEEYYAIDKQYDNTVAHAKNNELSSQLMARNYLIALISVVVAVLGVLVWWIFRRKDARTRQYMILIEQLQQDLVSAKDLRADQLDNELQVKLREALVKRWALFGELISLSYEYRGNGSLFIKKFDELLARDPLSSDAYNDILDIVNSTYYGLIDHLRSHYSTISEKELLICALTCVGYSSQQLFVILGAKNVETIYNQKYRIGVKFGMKGDLKLSLDKIVERLQNRQ